MKKLSIVMLAFLFVAGSVFAAELTVEGDVTASVIMELEKQEYGFDGLSNGLSTDFDINLATGSAASEGEGDLYAVLEASASLDIDEDGQPDEIIGDLSLDVFDIVYGDIIFHMLGATDGISKAASLDWNDDGDADMDEVAPSFGAATGTLLNGGMGISYDVFEFGVDFYSDPTDTEYLVFGAWSGDLEGIAVETAVAFDGTFYAGLAAGFETEMASIDVAADFADNFAEQDASLNVTAMVADGIDVDADFYFFNTAADLDLYADASTTVNIEGYEVSIALDGNTLISSWVLAPSASTTVDEFTVSADASFAKTKAWSLGGGVDYALDLGSVSLSGGYASTGEIDLAASFSTASMIDNATFDLGWETNDIANNNGAITASVTASL